MSVKSAELRSILKESYDSFRIDDPLLSSYQDAPVQSFLLTSDITKNQQIWAQLETLNNFSLSNIIAEKNIDNLFCSKLNLIVDGNLNFILEMTIFHKK